MKNINWKEQKVISIETRKGHFVLAQMGPSPYLSIFNLFSNDDSWDSIELKQQDVLFCHAITKQFLKKSTVREVKNVSPLQPVSYPEYWISEDPGSRKAVIWEGTPDEMTFITLGEGGASLIRNDITIPGFKETPVVIPSIPPQDLATIYKYELTSIAVYPEFNERLFLCSFLRKKVDPSKELLFNQDLPLIYKQYFQIVSGQVPLETLGY